ncbi:MAG: ABC transporter permease [Planctomycetota bacterium]
MRAVLLLIRSHLSVHRVRTLLTTLATASSVCLLVWIISIYSSAIRSFDLYASRALGHYDLIVDPVSRKANREVASPALELLRDEAQVAQIDPMWARLLTFRAERTDTDRSKGSQEVVDRHSREGGWEEVIIGSDAEAPPFPLLRGRWIAPDTSEGLQAVLSLECSERLGVTVGDELSIAGPTENQPRIQVVGVIEPPPATITGVMVGSRMLPSPSVGAVFVSMNDAERIHRTKPTITFAAVSLRDGVDVHTFRYRLAPALYALAKPVQFMTDLDMEEEMSEAAKASSMTLQAYVVGIVSVLLAFLVIFSTLSMGVTERARQFALLRAVALTKTQLSALIAGEGLALVSFGLLLGIPAGWFLVIVVDRATDGVIRNGVHVDWTGIGLAVLISGVASLLAGVLPAWRATRVKPLDAIAPQNATRVESQWLASFGWLLVAFPLIGLLPLVSLVFPPSVSDPIFARLMLGAAGLALGLLLLSPVLVRWTDRLCVPPLARLLRLPKALLQQQLTSQLWRTVACAVTLSVGMGLFAAIHVWGWSMVYVFVPTNWAPAATLVLERPLASDQIDQLREWNPALQVVPLMVEQPRLRDDLLNSAEFPSVTRQMVVVLAGLDPQSGFGGADPLVDTQWIAGTPSEAIAMMKSNRGCVVPDHFYNQAGLKLGDPIYLVPPESPENPVRYTLAGAVRLRGGQWMTKTTNMRMRTHRSAGLVFADYQSVAGDFQLPGPRHCWIQSDEASLDEDALLAAVQSVQYRLDTTLGQEGKPDARIMPTQDIEGHILSAAQFWLWFMSVVPLIAIAISSVAMLNIFLASVRARQWDFGILRALGFTRSVLIRIVIAEGILVGIVACLVGCAFGLIAGWCGTALTQTSSWFGGMDIALTLPLVTLLIGSGTLLTFAALAAVWPALKISSMSPLSLLDRGRGMSQ